MPSMQDGYSSTHMSDEDLQKVTVGELKPHNAPITLVEYDPLPGLIFGSTGKRP